MTFERSASSSSAAHVFLRRSTTSFEDEWHQFAARGWVALALLPNSISSSNTIVASSCPLTRLIAAMCAGHRSIDKDSAAADRIPTSNVQGHIHTSTCARKTTTHKNNMLAAVGWVHHRNLVTADPLARHKIHCLHMLVPYLVILAVGRVVA